MSNDGNLLPSRSAIRQLFLRYGIGFLINFAGTVIIARKAGPELWGLFAISQVVLTIFVVLSHGCWGYLIQQKTRPDRTVIGNSYTLQTIMSVSWVILIVLLSPLLADKFSSKDLPPLLLATAFGGFFYGWRYVICSLSERNLQYDVAAAAELSDIIIFNVVAVVMTLIGYPYWGVLVGNLVRGLTSTIIARIWSRQAIHFSFDRAVISDIAKYSVPYMSFIALQWLPIYAGPVVAGSFLGVRELGILQLAYRTVEYPRVLVTIAFRMSMGIFSRATQGVDELRENLKKVLDFLFFLLIPAMVALVALSPIWVPLVYGTSWKPMSNVMIIIMFPYLVMAVMLILSSLLSARGNSRASFIFYGIYNAIYWPLLIALVKKFGFFGLPVVEWVALAGCAALLLEIKRSGVGVSHIFSRIAVLLASSSVALFLWIIAYYRTLSEALIAGFIISALWFFISPAQKGITLWIRQYVQDVRNEMASAKSKK